MVNSLVYHGLSLNTSNLGIDVYLAFALSAAVEIPAYLLAFVIVGYFGRKLSVFGCMMLGGLACVSTAFIGMITAAMVLVFIVTNFRKTVMMLVINDIDER